MPPRSVVLRTLALTQGGVGVFGYVAHDGQDVTGAASLTLRLPVGAVADALRSIRVRDPAGPAREVTVATGASALPLDGPDWLHGLVGARVRVLQAGIGSDSVTMRGRIVRAERIGAATHLLILTDSGLRDAILERAGEIELKDEALRARIGDALASAETSGGKPTRTVRILTADGGPRPVGVDLVLPAPLWKPTWRLTLAAPGADGVTTARLEGWAVVENTGADDWHDLRLSLIAGNPVTFQNDVYAVVEVARPVVAVAGPAQIAPVEDTRAEAPKGAERMMAVTALSAPEMAPAPPPPPAQISESAATSVFALSQAVELPAGQTASLPFLDVSLPARLVDSLSPGAPHPVVAARVENTTGHTLPAGPVSTAIAAPAAGGSPFAGDALLGTLPAGQSRLLGFAEDGAVDAAWDEQTDQAKVGLAAADGVLTITERDRTTTTVTLTGAAEGARAVLVGVARETGTELADGSAKPFEQTDGEWRFLVPLAAAEHRTLTVLADRLVSSTVVLIDAETPTLVAILADADLPAAERAALQPIVGLREALATAQSARAALVEQRTRVSEEEERMRRNLAAVTPTEPFHARVLADLVKAENRISALAGEIDGADERVRDAQARLTAAVASLKL